MADDAWSNVTSKVDAISTRLKDLLGLDEKLSRIETRMDKFDRFGDKMDLIVSDQELKGKIDTDKPPPTLHSILCFTS
jgi:predicted component of type VI protein secretion system